MVNENLKALIKLIRTIDPTKFDFSCYAKIGAQYIRLKDLTKEMFDELYFTADPLGYYLTYINPEANILDLQSEFELTRDQYRTLFASGGKIVDKDGKKFIINNATTPNEWADAAQCVVDGNSISSRNYN